jgi:pimeloyl-ACP methyl ester carboxylesterase
VRKFALAVAGALLAGVTVAAPADAIADPAGHQPAAIDWGPCADSSLQRAGAQCGFLSVPLDYGRPGGTKIKLAVSRIVHTVPAAEYQGIMLVNPGGPGGSGLGLVTLGQYVPNGAGDAYDWIGFDPRGVGASQPALTCDQNISAFDRPNYVPTTRQLTETWLGTARRYAQACQRNNAALLRHVTTVDSARDMDSIRAALRQRQLNYFGFSYGTYLGQVYGTLFPDRVRRMVLDSNVDPRRVWYDANLDQDIAFEKNMKIWFGWLAKYDSVYHLGTSEGQVERLFYRVQADLDRRPAGGVIGPDEWTDVFLSAGYYQSTWLDLGAAFAGYVHDGDWQTLRDSYGGPGDDNGYAMYNAVQCGDVQWPQSWAKWERDNWRTYFQAPFETWGNAWYNAPCLYWGAPASTPVRVDGRKVASALLIDETLDAATPYTGSLEVRKLFPHASLIALPGGTSHANSLYGDACEDDQIAAYLADGTLPKRKPGPGPDTTCDPLPVPDPTAAAARTALTPQATPASPAPARQHPAIRW